MWFHKECLMYSIAILTSMKKNNKYKTNETIIQSISHATQADEANQYGKLIYRIVHVQM